MMMFPFSGAVGKVGATKAPTMVPDCEASCTAICVLEPVAPYLNTLADTCHPPAEFAVASLKLPIVVPPTTADPTTAVVALKIILTVLAVAAADNCPQAMML